MQRTLFEGIGQGRNGRRIRRHGCGLTPKRLCTSERKALRKSRHQEWIKRQGPDYAEQHRQRERNRIRSRTPEQRQAHQLEMMRLKSKRREMGLCVACGKIPTADGKLSCRPCLDKINARNARIKAENGERYHKLKHQARERRKASRFARYGMTLGQYEELLARQGGGCAVCGCKSPRGRHQGRFDIDHNHITQIVRGILCSHCNRAIGLLNDNPKVLRKAAHYLETAMTGFIMPPVKELKRCHYHGTTGS